MSLEKAAFITAIFGTVILIFLAEHLEPELTTINRITLKDLDNYVKIRGNITYVKQYESSILLKINDGTDSIYAILYGRTNITKDRSVTIIGRVIEYKGILEIEISKITSNDT